MIFFLNNFILKSSMPHTASCEFIKKPGKVSHILYLRLIQNINKKMLLIIRRY